MKITFVLSDLSSAGGIERVTSILTNTFISQNIDVTIVSLFHSKDNSIYDFPDKIKIVYLSEKKYLNKRVGGLSRFLLFLKVISKTKKYFKKNSCDFIIGQGFPVNFVLYSAGLKKMSIACEHVHYNYYNSLIRGSRNFIYRGFNQVVVLTDTDKYFFSQKISNVSLIPNPVSFFSDKNFSKMYDSSQKSIISVGRLEYQKGYDLLLQACIPVFSKHPDWQLNIYGDGLLRDDLFLLRDKLHLTKNVFFRGIVDNIYDKYLESSIYVLSSRFEGFGMVLVEAASCGLPIVSFDCPNGPNDILNGDRGILVKPNDITSLSKAIVKLIENQELREYYSLKGQEIVMQYKPEKIFEMWKVLFLKLRSNK